MLKHKTLFGYILEDNGNTVVIEKNKITMINGIVTKPLMETLETILKKTNEDLVLLKRVVDENGNLPSIKNGAKIKHSGKQYEDFIIKINNFLVVEDKGSIITNGVIFQWLDNETTSKLLRIKKMYTNRISMYDCELVLYKKLFKEINLEDVVHYDSLIIYVTKLNDLSADYSQKLFKYDENNNSKYRLKIKYNFDYKNILYIYGGTIEEIVDKIFNSNLYILTKNFLPTNRKKDITVDDSDEFYTTVTKTLDKKDKLTLKDYADYKLIFKKNY